MNAPYPELEPVFASIRDGRMDRALEQARRLAESSTGDLALEARRHVGLCFFHLGDYASSVPNLLEVARGRNDRQSWFVLSLARTLAGDPSGGRQDFEKALAQPEPQGGDDGRQLTEHFMRFDYMHVLVDTWQWQRAQEQLDALASALSALPSQDNEYLFDRGYPLLGDLLESGLRVLEIVPDSNPIKWLSDLRKRLDGGGRKKVDQALVALARRIGPQVL